MAATGLTVVGTSELIVATDRDRAPRPIAIMYSISMRK
jgi:hypothetical protein